MDLLSRSWRTHLIGKKRGRLSPHIKILEGVRHWQKCDWHHPRTFLLHIVNESDFCAWQIIIHLQLPKCENILCRRPKEWIWHTRFLRQRDNHKVINDVRIGANSKLINAWNLWRITLNFTSWSVNCRMNGTLVSGRRWDYDKGWLYSLLCAFCPLTHSISVSSFFCMPESFSATSCMKVNLLELHNDWCKCAFGVK